MMITVEIVWFDGISVLNLDYQTKNFKDESAYIEWCRRNSKHIFSINGHATYGQKMDHFVLIDYLRGE